MPSFFVLAVAVACGVILGILFGVIFTGVFCHFSCPVKRWVPPESDVYEPNGDEGVDAASVRLQAISKELRKYSPQYRKPESTP